MFLLNTTYGLVRSVEHIYNLEIAKRYGNTIEIKPGFHKYSQALPKETPVNPKTTQINI